MSSSAARDAWAFAFQCSPILLTRGIATGIVSGVQSGVLPIIALTDAASLATGILTGGLAGNINPDDFFASYYPMPGATLLAQQVATYPMANQAIAANAVIAQPLNVSMMMCCPVRPGSLVAGVLGGIAGAFLPTTAAGLGGSVSAGVGAIGGYPGKLATMTALQNTLAQHNNQGGTYSIVTPAFIYVDCIMTGMRYVGDDNSKQKQSMWQLDFIQPLVSIASAQGALNSQMQKIQSQMPLNSGAQAVPAAGLPAGGATAFGYDQVSFPQSDPNPGAEPPQ